MSTSHARASARSHVHGYDIPTSSLGFSLVRDSEREGESSASSDSPNSDGGPRRSKLRGAAALNLRHGLPPQSVLEVLRKANGHNGVTYRVLAFHLAEVADCNYAPRFGYPNAEVFAERELRLHRRSARNLIIAGRRLEELTEIDAAFAEGLITWSAVRELVRIATRETELEWLELAKRVSQRKLEKAVSTSRKGDSPNKKKCGLPTNFTKVQLRLGTASLDKWSKLMAVIKDITADDDVDDDTVVATLFEIACGIGDAESFSKLSPSTLMVCPKCDETSIVTEDGPEVLSKDEASAARRNSGPAGIPGASDRGDDDAAQGSPEDTDPPINEKTRRFVLGRDGHRCVCCSARANLQVHHVIWRSRGGTNALTNLTSVCARCHSIIHDGNMFVTGDAPNRLSITRPHSQSSRSDVNCTAWVKEIVDRVPPAPAPETRSSWSSSVSAAVRTYGNSPIGVTPTMPRSAGDSGRMSGTSQSTPISAGDIARTFSGTPTMPEAVDHHAEVSGVGGCSRLHFASEAVNPSSSLTPPANPSAFDHLRGVVRTISALRRAANSAKKRGCAMPHVLLSGPAGLGKSTLARATASYIGANFRESNATGFVSLRGVADMLCSLRPNEVIFIDEIQALKPEFCTMLLQALQEGFVSIPQGDDQSMPERVELPPFTLVAATTEPDALNSALRSRFPVIQELVRYSVEELVEVVDDCATRESLTVNPEVAKRIAGHAVGIPRTAIALFDRARDVAVDMNATVITMEHLAVAESDAGLDKEGLTPQERALVNALQKYGPTARGRVAVHIGMSLREVRMTLEPSLVRKGVINISSRGLSISRTFGTNFHMAHVGQMKSSAIERVGES